MSDRNRGQDRNIQLQQNLDPYLTVHEPGSADRIRLVRLALHEVLRSSPFRSSTQCQKLLTYLVDKSLAGRDELLRERVIGAEVFGREPDYDAANDPIVRARAAEVRKRLAQYYLSPGSVQPRVRIEIPSGHYRVRFEFAVGDGGSSRTDLPAAPTQSAAAELPEGEPSATVVPAGGPVLVPLAAKSVRRRPRWIPPSIVAGCVAVALLAAGLAFRTLRPATPAAFDQFWSPAMKSQMPVIIYSGTNVVYRLSPAFLDQYRKSHHLENNGPEFAVDLKSAGPLRPEDFLPSTNAYVTVGDISAFTAITSMLAQHRKPYELRYAADISPGDLHSGPTVLVGAFNNRWTLDVTNPLRFAFAGGDTIRDKVTGRSWSVRVKPDGSTTDDYAIVSRLLSADGRETIMTAAGIGQYGTQAASEFLSSPAKIAEFSRTAPAGWERMNLQIVLHILVVDDVPGSVDVVATHSW
jgi:hypothetical protein